jgi:tetratricopeptide (TPR) repeat protein
MAKPKHTDLTENGVITQEALLAYAEGRLSDADRVQMDKLLKDDPFAQEALEGMRTSPKPGEIHTAITRINTQLHERAGIRERKKKGIEIHWANYAYAAVIIAVLIGVGFILINYFSNQNDLTAMNSPGPKAEVSAPVAPDQTTKDEPKIDTAKAIADSLSAKASTTAADSVAKIDTSAKKKITTQSQQPISAPQNSNSNTPLTTAPIGGEVAAQLGVARTYFEAGNYIDAEKKYNEILASQPNNADALYFGGIASYLNGSKGLGEANFDKLAKSSLYPEGVKWYKANILIKKGKKEEAKPLLRDLINTNSIFKDRAVKEYEDLYK